MGIAIPSEFEQNHIIEKYDLFKQIGVENFGIKLWNKTLDFIKRY